MAAGKDNILELPVSVSLAVTNTLRRLYSPVGVSAADIAPVLKSLASPEAEPFVTSLTLAANNAAAANACGSVLAGHTSEGDEFGDVALWLGEGEFGEGHEEDVLRTLDLAAWLKDDAKPRSVKLGPAGLSPTFKAEPSDPDLQGLVQILATLKDKHLFTIDRSQDFDGSVAYFLLGHHSEGKVSGWVALAGMGIALDYYC